MKKGWRKGRGRQREPQARKTSEQFKLPFQVVTLFMRTKIIRWQAGLAVSLSLSLSLTLAGVHTRDCILVLFHFSRQDKYTPACRLGELRCWTGCIEVVKDRCVSYVCSLRCFFLLGGTNS